MNERAKRLLATRGAIGIFVGLALLLTTVGELALAVAPEEDSGPRRARRDRESNDGALPESENDWLDWSEATRDVGNWFDKETSKRLREEVLEAARRNRERWPEFPEIDDAKGKSLGVRKIEKGRVVFRTDLPSSPEVDEIPEAREAAIAPICEFFSIDEERFADLKIEAFLMGDVDKFISIKALDGPPRFLYGYSMADRIYAKDQKLGYYNRFLLTHELVHTLMHEIFGDLRPRWYSEGSAEYIGLHEWDPERGTMKLARIPDSEESTPGFGRLNQIRESVESGEVPTLDDILRFEPRDFVDVSTYSWSWALVMFLYNSPKYKKIAEVMPYWSMLDEPNRLFVDAIGDRWDEFELDWADFIRRIDYRYDFVSSSISRAKTTDENPDLDEGATVAIDAARGWRRTGIRLKAGESYEATAEGRFDFYVPEAEKTLEFEASGAGFDYFRGKPIGRLELVVLPDSEKKTYDDFYRPGSAPSIHQEEPFRFDAFRDPRSRDGRKFPRRAKKEPIFASPDDAGDEGFSASDDATYPWSQALGFEGRSLELRPNVSGELCARINARPGDLRENKGSVRVTIRRK